MAVRTSSELLQAFAALVQSRIDDERIDLLRAALTFARVEYPHLDPEPYIHQVEELSRRAAALIDDPGEPAEWKAEANLHTTFPQTQINLEDQAAVQQHNKLFIHKTELKWGAKNREEQFIR